MRGDDPLVLGAEPGPRACEEAVTRAAVSVAVTGGGRVGGGDRGGRVGDGAWPAGAGREKADAPRGSGRSSAPQRGRGR